MSTPTVDRSPAKVTTLALRRKKAAGERITMLTAYDYPTALALDQAGIDSILVGDSLGMVVLGYDNTLPVTMDEMIHHCRAVARGARRPLLIGDMPFLSYQVAPEEAVRNAGRFLQQGGMDAVKVEGGRERLPAIGAILQAGIPVMGHVGLTPQSIHQLGGFRPQGRTAQAAVELLGDAIALEEAGCFAIVLESIPQEWGEEVSRRLSIPTIGIGAGAGCNGQVLVTHDLLGLFERFTPRFARRYADLQGEMKRAFAAYIRDVEAGQFPGTEHSLAMDPDELRSALKALRAGAAA